MKDKEIKEILDKLYLDFEKAGLTAPEYSDLRDYITNLQEENERLKGWKQDLLNENIELENIRKEAIEYINHENFKRTILVGVGTKKYTKNILDNVLNILQGDNKN